MSQKLEVSRQNLLAGEKLLAGGLESIKTQLEAQNKEMEELNQICNNSKLVLEKDLQNLEEVQSVL